MFVWAKKQKKRKQPTNQPIRGGPNITNTTKETVTKSFVTTESSRHRRRVVL